MAWPLLFLKWLIPPFLLSINNQVTEKRADVIIIVLLPVGWGIEVLWANLILAFRV